MAQLPDYLADRQAAAETVADLFRLHAAGRAGRANLMDLAGRCIEAIREAAKEFPQTGELSDAGNIEFAHETAAKILAAAKLATLADRVNTPPNSVIDVVTFIRAVASGVELEMQHWEA